ncbi:F-BAR domain only protein 2 isoform X2 [Neocloeon triangulifer]|uniref:F-BAR domain only protein 2 isoform X2 n=1 Tax=Neocloeon triangulifer TaxID=2078957 RepID=UPI00286F0B02|nr:F-BAR domain only protein 2 isoform X2 [Neocloeon triangulifer]
MLTRRKGEKNNGFDVLYHNMKHGVLASKELSEYLRERAIIEENICKLLTKHAKTASSSTGQGTFAPLWTLLKNSSEKLSTLHGQMFQKISDLVKDVTKYSEELHKKHKTVKEDESMTLEVVQSIQATTLAVQKAKDVYTQRSLELDKLRKENASAKDVEKSEVKVRKAQEEYKTLVEKYAVTKEDFERKMLIACKHFQEVEEAHVRQMKEFLSTYADDLLNNHDQIGQVHLEFKRSCLDLTVDKLLEQFVLNKYTGLEKPEQIEFEEVSISGGPVSTAVSVGGGEVASLKDEKANGSGDKPVKKESASGNLEAGRPTKQSKPSRRTTSLLNLFMPNSQGLKESGETTSAPTSPTGPNNTTTNTASLVRNPLRGTQKDSPPRSPYTSISTWTTGFLRSRREKKKEKKAKKNSKKDSQDNNSNKEDKSDGEDKDDGSSRKSGTPPPPEVDDEGYRIRPKVDNWDNDKNFYSSSDTDSDDERDRKIHVQIKPQINGTSAMSASVDELRATVENMTLSSVGQMIARRGSSVDHDGMKRSQSVSQQLGGKPSSDLLGLNLFQSPSSSVASTPSGANVSAGQYSQLQSPPALSSPRGSPAMPQSEAQTSRYADLGDIFAEVGEMQPALPPKQRQTPTPTMGSIAIPRPPSRRGEGTPQLRGRVSPASPAPSNIARADSTNSLEFRTSGVLNSSRGPSPLTIGMSDTVPLAVAFHEIIHAFFRGSDETRCQIKMSGDMMLSFPAGIVTILANNPSPAQLSFKVKNSHRLENVVPNRQLITLDASQSTTEVTSYEFNMSALTALLRRQFDQNPTASYFNVDILKYQIKSKSGASSCPFQLVSYWKCEKGHTDLRVDYKYNSHAMASPSPLLNLTVAVPVDGGVLGMQSKPNGLWVAESNRAMWKFTELSQHSENHGVGSLRARFELSNGPGSQGTIATQFNCEGTTLSGAEFELVGTGYRLSLVKRRFVSGKYICDADFDSKYRYAAPPGPTAC